jgi:hypothetical protein
MLNIQNMRVMENSPVEKCLSRIYFGKAGRINSVNKSLNFIVIARYEAILFIFVRLPRLAPCNDDLGKKGI